MREGPSIQVRVYDFNQQLLPEARVTLVSTAGANGDATALSFDPIRSAHVSAVETPLREGTYTLHAEASGLQMDLRHVTVGKEELREDFVLGTKGLPCYYLGGVKVPFTPYPDLMALSLQPGAGPEAEKDLLSGLQNQRRFGLKPILLHGPILHERVRILRTTEGTPLAENSEVARELARRPEVRWAGPVIRFDGESVAFLTNQIIVRFKPLVGRKKALALTGRHRLEILEELSWAGNVLLTTTGKPASMEILRLCDRLVRSNDVEWAEPNLVTTAVNAHIPPRDFLYQRQWHVERIGLRAAWTTLRRNGGATRRFGSKDVILAIMDDGVKSRTVGPDTRAVHPDFDGNIGGEYKVYRFYDFNTGQPNNDPPAGVVPHGVMCAGIAAALADNKSAATRDREGIAGAAGGCRIMALIRPQSACWTDHADAYLWTAGLKSFKGHPAPAPGADVISNSFTVNTPTIPGIVAACFDTLAADGRNGKGALVLFAAGNHGSSQFWTKNSWAAHPKNIAIAATDQKDVLDTTPLNASNYGYGITLCAPTNIPTCDEVGDGNLLGHTRAVSMDYERVFGGTSAATALAAGVAALVLSKNPNLTRDQVVNILTKEAKKIDPQDVSWVQRDANGDPVYSIKYGYGRIDAEKAVGAA